MIDEITEFIIEHHGYYNKELIKEYVEFHNKYGTIDYAIDHEGYIIAVCRWNMSDDGRIAQVLDFAINEKWRNQGIGNDFIRRALKRFPSIEWLEFRRGLRNKKLRKLEVKKVLLRSF